MSSLAALPNTLSGEKQYFQGGYREIRQCHIKYTIKASRLNTALQVIQKMNDGVTVVEVCRAWECPITLSAYNKSPLWTDKQFAFPCCMSWCKSGNTACLLIRFGRPYRPTSPYPRPYLPTLQVLRCDIRSLDPYWVGTPASFCTRCVGRKSTFNPYGRSQTSRPVLRVSRMVNRHRRPHPVSVWADVPGVEG